MNLSEILDTFFSSKTKYPVGDIVKLKINGIFVYRQICQDIKQTYHLLEIVDDKSTGILTFSTLFYSELELFIDSNNYNISTKNRNQAKRTLKLFNTLQDEIFYKEIKEKL